VELAKRNRQEENLEECDEDLRLWEAEEDECEEGGEPAVEDRRPDGPQGVHRLVQTRTLCYEVGMRNVNWVVNAEANGEDDADAGGHVDGHLPEVEEPDDVDQGQRHARQHHHADLWGKYRWK